jgi:hypothetical protein
MSAATIWYRSILGAFFLDIVGGAVLAGFDPSGRDEFGLGWLGFVSCPEDYAAIFASGVAVYKS